MTVQDFKNYARIDYNDDDELIQELIEGYYKFGFKNVASKALLMTNDTVRKLTGTLITPQVIRNL